MFLMGFFQSASVFTNHRSLFWSLINQLKSLFYIYGSQWVKEDCTPPHVTSTYINGIKLKLQLKKGESLENNKKIPVFFMC